MSETFIFSARVPALRILIPLVAGIITGEYLHVVSDWSCWLAGTTILSLLLFPSIPVYHRFRLQFLRGMLVWLLIFSGGILLIQSARITSKANWYGHAYEKGQQLLLRVEEPFVQHTKSIKTKTRIIGKWHDKKLLKTTGGVWLYCGLQAIPGNCPPGTLIITKQAIQPIKNSGNPGTFDYAAYSLRQGITGQIFIRDSTQLLIVHDSSFSFRQKILEWREVILHQLRKYIPGKAEAGLAEALLVGYKEDLDEDILRSYSNTGVVHVIAVSGMHLALIYWLIQKLLTPLAAIPRTKWISFFIAIVLLWLFSLIAGSAASIIRAAVMFTCLLLGQTLSRESNIYNTLAASGMLLLCYDPYWLWDAGFQLSYLAVLSIVLFYKYIYNLVYCRYRLLDWVWQLCAVTCAAQILTTPLSIYLFHQFPVCFLFTNLPIVPLSSLILIMEIGLLAVGFSPWLSQWLGIIISWMIRLMNNIISTIEKLPFAIWDNLNINPVQVFLLYVFIALLAWGLIGKTKKALMISLLTINIFAGIRYFDFRRAARQQVVIIFNLPEGSRISFVTGRRQWVAQRKKVSEASMRNNLRPAYCTYRSAPVDTLAGLNFSENLVSYNGCRILIADSGLKIRRIRENINADMLLVCGSVRDSAAVWLGKIHTRQLVIERRISERKRTDWKTVAARRGIPVHDMNEKGAFVMKKQ